MDILIKNNRFIIYGIPKREVINGTENILNYEKEFKL